MFSVCWVTLALTHMATRKSRATRFGATTLWMLLKVRGYLGFNFVVLVYLVVQRQSWADSVHFLQMVNNLWPLGVVLVVEHLQISYDVEPLLSSGKRYTDSVLDPEKTNVVFRIASDKGEQNDLVLFSLKVIHSCHTNSFKDLPLHLPPKLKELPSVHGQNGDFLGCIALLQQIVTELNYVLHFVLVHVALGVRGTIVFFWFSVVDEEDVLPDTHMHDMRVGLYIQ